MYERWGATEKAALLRERCATLAPYGALKNNKPRSKVIFDHSLFGGVFTLLYRKAPQCLRLTLT